VSSPSAQRHAHAEETEPTKKPLHKKKVVWVGTALVLLVGVAVVAKSRRDKGERATAAAAARDRITALARERAGTYLSQAQNALPSSWPEAVRNTLTAIPQSKRPGVRRAMSYACQLQKMTEARAKAR
jgi:hypothetical protein